MNSNAIGNPHNSGDPRPWYRRYPAAFFLGSLLLAYASSPFTEELKYGDLIEVLRLSVLLLSGLVAMGGRRRTLIWGMALAGPALVCKWLNHFHPSLVPPWAFLTPAVLFVAFLLAILFGFILRAPHVNSEVVCAGIAGYFLLGFLWALAYVLVGQFSANAFAFSAGPSSGQVMKGFTALYYSFITLSTVGYGDIVPVSGAARMLAMVEATTGVFYTTILIARLVTLYSSSPPIAVPLEKEGL